MLQIDSLQIRYGDFLAVSSASLMVPDGKIVALIGVNGAGKTSFLNAVAGLVRPSKGRVLLDGEDLTGKPPEDIVNQGLALVPQGGRCFARMSVCDNLLVGSHPKKARRHAEQTMERVFALFPVLKEKRKDPAGILSGGERQMLAIGRAMMSEPKCLMIDELSLGLAPIVIRDLYMLIHRINQENSLSVILVEQNTERALRNSDLCCVMRKGETVLACPTGSVSSECIKQAFLGFETELEH